MRFILALFAIAMTAATPSHGQTQAAGGWPIAPDSRVRILSPVLGKRLVTGSVVSATPDTLVFRADSESTSTAIATPTITRLDVGFGKHTNKARRGCGRIHFRGVDRGGDRIRGNSSTLH